MVGDGAKLTKKSENNKKYGKICIFSIIVCKKPYINSIIIFPLQKGNIKSLLIIHQALRQ